MNRDITVYIREIAGDQEEEQAGNKTSGKDGAEE